MATITLYNNYYIAEKKGQIVLDSQTQQINLALMQNNPNVIIPTNTTWNQISSYEIPGGGGYTSGGQALTGKQVVWSGGAVFRASPVSWENATFITRYGVLYETTGGLLICYIDFDGQNQNVQNATFSINWNSVGIFRTRP